MGLEAAIRNDSTVWRLEMEIQRKQYTPHRDADDPRFLQPQLTTFLVIRAHENCVHDSIMSLEASPANPSSINRMRRFIESTRLHCLYLNISIWDEFADEFGSLIAATLQRPTLETVEISAEHDDIPVGIVDLLVQDNIVTNTSWCELALVNHSVDYYQVQAEVSAEHIFSAGVPAFVYDRIEGLIPTLSVELAGKISHLLKVAKNVESLRLDAIRVPIETFVPHRRIDAARLLSAGIRFGNSLKCVSFRGTRMQVEAQDLLSESISQNTAITECHVEGAHGRNDLLRIVENLIPNDRLQFYKIASFQDPQAFEIIGSVLRTRIYIKDLKIALFEVGPGRVSSHEIDGFINALVESDKLTIGRLELSGRIDLTTKQWKKLWKAFRRIKCHSVAVFARNMPENWEHDFVAALPTMPFKDIHICSNKQFDTDIVGHDLIYSALRKNYAVENFFLATTDFDKTRPRKDWLQLGYLNWAGRRIELLEPNAFNPALWPVILQRINFTNFEDKIEACDLKCIKADAIFSFLRGPLLDVLSRNRSDNYLNAMSRSKKRRLCTEKPVPPMI